MVSGTALRPNHLTALRLAAAAGAALAFAVGTPGWIVAGAAAFTVSALLDRADGTLARMTGRFSRLGHRLDLIADLTADTLVFVAMGVGAAGGWLGWRAPVLGVMAGAATALLFWHLNRPGTAKRPPAARLADPDDLILLVPLLACGVGLAPVLLLAGLITPVVAAALILQGRRVAG